MSRLYDEDDYETEGLLKEISSNLGKQISEELDKDIIFFDENDRRRSQTASRAAGNVNNRSGMSAKPAAGQKQGMNKKKIAGIAAIVVAALLLTVVLVGNYFLNRINYEDGDIIVDEEGNETVVSDIVPSDKDIINILLIGEEAMADGDRGRSDAIMVATINQKYDRLTVTSFMRDCYIVPTGYTYGCKLNEVYKKGGGPLLVSTIEENFQIQIDGYARVNFDSFEEIIDLLGGVEIELTADEAQYLNRTNYISNPSNRNVTVGVQTLNGNQALGYSRVRYVKGIDGERDDFGRTNRQRTVIKAIFNEYKSKNLIELIAVTNQILPHITTNMTKGDILSYLAVAAGMLTNAELETFRVPMNDAYSGEKINGKAYLVVNYEKVRAALQEEMYGTGYLTEEEKAALEAEQNDNTATGTTE